MQIVNYPITPISNSFHRLDVKLISERTLNFQTSFVSFSPCQTDKYVQFVLCEIYCKYFRYGSNFIRRYTCAIYLYLLIAGI